MTVSDEKLSAFLDAELPENEMEFIREQISEDETLANRLAELAMVDAQIAQHYSAIDARPLPDAIANLLASAPTDVARDVATPISSATIIPFPLWKKVQRGLQQHAAVAACTALVLGFGLAQLLPGTQDSSRGDWNAIAAALDTAASGTEHKLANDKRIKPRLTFINQQGAYCRQFRVSDLHSSSETIACRIGDNWEPSVTIYTQGISPEGDYQTATNDASVLDQALDTMMHGDAFDAQAESAIIERGWKND
ncbi:anti-sigma factor family protein [Cellvibrio fibrivorans]|uniref:Negative regulator of sigma E activity n=1 Tax=Cellvibrio fibrivorans TaxID=126350 RepID=A0ABU1UT09_9GAMM|nr:hypothetical protein [Cellvibrio fibrivorans]MDR7088319.1 negative regulator of sigma E activity [Cellvibrio fibrivorans]